MDQKITLTEQEKAIIAQKRKQKKNQVTINEQHWTMLKERREIEELRELQVVLLFSQLLQQGLIQVQLAMEQMLPKLTVEELTQSSKRQELPLFYQEVLSQLSKGIAPIEKQLKSLVRKGSHLIEPHQGYWQIKNRQMNFPIQMMLPTFESEFSKIVFPNTLVAEALLEEKVAELIEMKAQLDLERKKVIQERNTLNRHIRKSEEDEERRVEKQKILDYWTSLVSRKKMEHAYVQEKIRPMELLHPLKRKQHEYQAYVLRDQIIQQELTKANLEVKKATGIYRVTENQAKHSKKEWLAVQEQEKEIKSHLAKHYHHYKKATQAEVKLRESFQEEYHTAYQELKGTLEQYVVDIHEEQEKAAHLESYYRKHLNQSLEELKKLLKEAPKPIEKKILAFLKQELLADQTSTFLSQANADAINVRHLLEES